MTGLSAESPSPCQASAHTQHPKGLSELQTDHVFPSKVIVLHYLSMNPMFLLVASRATPPRPRTPPPPPAGRPLFSSGLFLLLTVSALNVENVHPSERGRLSVSVAFAGMALVAHSMCPQQVNSFFPFVGLSLVRTSVGSPPRPLPSSGCALGVYSHMLG